LFDGSYAAPAIHELNELKVFEMIILRRECIPLLLVSTS